MKRTEHTQLLNMAKTIVIKIGSSRISGTNREINDFMSGTAWDIKKLRDQGHRVIIVSSGAVSQGKMVELPPRLKNSKTDTRLNPATTLQVRQALAAMGQSKLMSLYESFFSKLNIPIAQILFGILDIQEKSGYTNLKNTFDQLLNWNVLPIINENDSIATEELKFGDNDILSALVSVLVGADLLIIMTGTNGFFKNKQRVSLLEEISPSDLKAAKGPTGPGTGGMRTKLMAAEVLLLNGIKTAILPGDTSGVITRFMNGEDIGTLVSSKKTKSLMDENEIKLIFNQKFFKSI